MEAITFNLALAHNGSKADGTLREAVAEGLCQNVRGEEGIYRGAGARHGNIDGSHIGQSAFYGLYFRRGGEHRFFKIVFYGSIPF